MGLVMNEGTHGSYMVGYRVKQSFLVKGIFGNIYKFYKSLQNIGFSSMLATEKDKKNPLRTDPNDFTFVTRSVIHPLLISTRMPYFCLKICSQYDFLHVSNHRIMRESSSQTKIKSKAPLAVCLNKTLVQSLKSKFMRAFLFICFGSRNNRCFLPHCLQGTYTRRLITQK